MIPSASSSGLLVLGMHRSGTSALTRVLNLCGADIGTRILGGSAGNESGHWEDAVAVELHERLLASMGTRWDEAFGVPVDWSNGEAAATARETLRTYLEANRSRHALWAVKDPRLSLFAKLWIDGGRDVGQSLGAVLMLRHPLEVAGSLSARDGIAPGRGLLLWLDYTMAAAQAVEGLPCVLITYDQLLGDWRSCIDRISTLPGGQHLRVGKATSLAVNEFLDGSRRHHKSMPMERMPKIISEVWNELSALALDGRIPAGVVDRLAKKIFPIRELLHPLLGEQRLIQRQLWGRIHSSEVDLPAVISRYEQHLAIGTQGIERQNAGLNALHQSVTQQHTDVITAISDDIRQMQGMVSASLERAASSEGKVAVAEQLAARLSEELGALTQATEAAAREREADALRSLLPRLDEAVAARTRLEIELDEAVAVRTRLELELVRMQNALATSDHALAQLTASHAEAEERAAQLDQQVGELEAIRDQRQLQIVGLLREVHELRSQSALLERVVLSRSWRLTRPLRALRRLFGGQWTSDDSKQLRRVLRRRPLGPPSAAMRPNDAAHLRDLALSFGIAPQMPGMPDVFVWAVIDWHFRHQRPQHLAQALAEKGHRVFYISNNFVDDPEPGFRVDPLGATGRLFQVHLHQAGSPAIYFGMPDDAQVERMRSSLAELLKWTSTCSSVSLVQHPYWSDLLRAVPNARVVYDCMDHHAGFDNNASSILAAEERIIADADLVIVTSTWLEQELGGKARATALIRNASEFEFFQHPPERTFTDTRSRRVVGYYGAIAEWFDPTLVRQVAEAYPQVLVVLVGSDTAGVQAQLADLENVQFTGEVPYSELPYWLHGMDVCLLPFRVIPLTLATNPVKVYEYLSAGKPVVAVDLPELSQFGDLVEIGATPAEFTNAVGRMLESGQEHAKRTARQAFAAAQTWGHRAQALDAELSRLQEPRVSVIVLTFNNLAFTQASLSSIEAYSDYQNLEVLVVDNASSDGSREWLQEWVDEHSAAGHARRLILNDNNIGFSAGNNVGLRAATGDFLVILNNDTYVTPGWVRTLCAHLRKEPTLGLVGPVTNNIGNEARIEIHYSDMAGMIEQSGAHTRANPGRLVPIRTAAFFCVAMPRRVYEVVGDMDEEFGVGFFEDDDYCRRIERAGYTVACAEDVFIHHHLSASFEKLGSERKRLLFERNKAIYEAKWGEWIPHAYRGAAPPGVHEGRQP